MQVGAPTVSVAVLGEGASVVTESAHAGELKPAGDPGRSGSAILGSIAELTIEVGTPTVHDAVIRETAGIPRSRADSGEDQGGGISGVGASDCRGGKRRDSGEEPGWRDESPRSHAE
jgi:hypothetical protein